MHASLKYLFMLTPALMLAGAPAARAETLEEYCVESGGALRDAFEEINAQVAAGTANDRYRLKIVKGNHFPPGLPTLGSLAQPMSSIELLGGYEPGCAGRTIEPQLTALNPGDGDGIGGLIEIVARGDVLVEGLLLLPSGGPGIDAMHPLVRVRQAEGALRRAYWTVSQSLLHGKANEVDDTPAIAAIDFIVGAENTPPVTVRIENSVVKGFGNTDCAVQYSEYSPFIPLAGHELILVNDTIAYNETCGVRASGLDDDTRVLLHNNIIGLNVGDGIITSGDADAEVELHNNILPTVDAVESKIVVNRNTLNVDPELLSFDLPVPKSASPAVNSGTTFVPGGLTERDADNGARWRGSLPDRGAFETSFNDLDTYTVTNTDGLGTPGSLRQAIVLATQDPGPARIVFDIKDGQGVSLCPAVIELDSALVVGSDVLIDGFSQPGSSRNTMETGSNAVHCIHLSGAGKNINALDTANVDETILGIEGLGLVGFGTQGSGFTAIELGNGFEEIDLRGNHFGADLANATVPTQRNSRGISAAQSGFVTIGGRDAADRNLFVDNELAVAVTKGTQLQLSGNYFGSNPTGAALARPGSFTDHILLEDIPAAFSMERNLVMGRFDFQQRDEFFPSSGRSIRGNAFSVAASCLSEPSADCLDPALTGSGASFQVRNLGAVGAVRSLSIEENVIGRYVFVDEANSLGAKPKQVSISRNRFRGAPAGLHVGAAAGNNNPESDNDVDPARMGDANLGQNFPVLASASGSTFEGTVSGTLSTRTGSYVIEVFAADKCFASFAGEQGDDHRLIGIGSTTVVDDGVSNGMGAFQIDVRSETSLAGQQISATATDSLGDSSEFSFAPSSTGCVTYASDAITDAIFADGFED